MNIMHIVFSFNNGGIENLLVDILNNWNNKSDKLFLCIINNNYDENLLNKLLEKNIQVIKLNRPVGGEKLKYIKKLVDIIIKKNIKVIHCHSNSTVKFCMIPKLKIKDIKLVYTVHDTMTYPTFNKIDVLIHKLFVRKIIAISKCVQDNIVKKYGASNKVITLYNGVDVNKFIEKKDKSKKYRIGCIARLCPPIKGQDTLIRAIAILKKYRSDFECYIVGAPPSEKNNYLEELKELAIKLEVTDLVKFTGNTNDVPKVLSKLDLAVVPSRKEGFGITIIEAFLSKVPVIASNLEGPKEIIKDNVYGELFESEDYVELSEKIYNIMNENNTVKTEAAYSYAVNKFSINSMVENLRKVYLEL